MAITINLSELKKDFNVYGISLEKNSVIKVVFKKGIEYFGFMVKRKKRNFTSNEKK